ncbi:MAG: fibronectin type III domain-containing protein [Bacillota bacterium]
MNIKRIICLLVTLTMVFSMTTVTAGAASFTSKPTGVKAKCVSGAAVLVSCKAKSGATGYNFYYSTKKGGKYTLGATSSTRSATVRGLTAGKRYYFKVRAFQGTDVKTYSRFSKPVKCKTKLKKPSIKVTDKCDCKVYLKMTCQEGTKGFAVYRSTKKKRGYKKIKTVSSGASVEWNDSGLKASTTYYYKVKAVSGSYKTKYSNVVAVKTLGTHENGNGASFSLANSGTSKYAADFAKRNIFFLGSSITYGSMSEGVAVPNYIAKRSNLTHVYCKGDRTSLKAGDGVVWKEAVSSTTLSRVKNDTGTYAYRLHKYYSDTKINPDLFVCQLSLNDANRGLPMGSMKEIDFDKLQDENEVDAYLEELYANSFNVAGAIEYITAFAYAKWPDCKVVFYTIKHFNGGNSAKYVEMINLLKKEAGPNKIGIIDLWSNSTISAWSGNNLCKYMGDKYHPRKAGYLQWTPIFEERLAAWMPAMPDNTVTWMNGDEVLEKDENVRLGTRFSYDGDKPTKEADEEFTYEFAGWRNQAEGPSGEIYTDETLGRLMEAGNVTFVAEFDKVPIEQPEEPSENVVNDQNADGQNGEPADTEQNGQPEGGGDSESVDNDGNEGEPGAVPDITGMIQTLLRAA